MNTEEELMRRAIALAKRANPFPNPRVGAVIARNGRIIGEGYHHYCGGDHAEVDAIKDAKRRGNETKGARMFVTLEPCSHWGRTPPCTDAIVAAGITKVIYACADPDRKIGGAGKLKKAGIKADGGLLEVEASALMEEFKAFKKFNRPLVSLHFAITLDGKMATRTGDSRGISGKESLRRLHELRSSHDAVLVGRGTVEKDNPRLTARIIGGRDPIRVILDSKLSLSPKKMVFSEKRGKAMVVAARPVEKTKMAALQKKGVKIIACGRDGKIDLKEMLSSLADFGVSSILVEGGPTVLTSFIEQRRFDRVYAFVAPKLMGGKDAPTPFGGKGAARVADCLKFGKVAVEILGEDLFLEARPKWNA